MTLVQIDLRGGRARGPRDILGTTDAAEGDHAATQRTTARASTTHESTTAPVATDSLAPATAGLVLAGGLVLLAPLAIAAGHSFPALMVLLAGLVTLGLLTVLLLPALSRAREDAPP